MRSTEKNGYRVPPSHLIPVNVGNRERNDSWRLMEVGRHSSTMTVDVQEKP